MTLAEPIPEHAVVVVRGQEGTIVHVHHGGDAYDVKFSGPSRVETIPAREIQAVISVPPDR
jgi:hypothetical protein